MHQYTDQRRQAHNTHRTLRPSTRPVHKQQMRVGVGGRVREKRVRVTWARSAAPRIAAKSTACSRLLPAMYALALASYSEVGP